MSISIFFHDWMNNDIRQGIKVTQRLYWSAPTFRTPLVWNFSIPPFKSYNSHPMASPTVSDELGSLNIEEEQEEQLNTPSIDDIITATIGEAEDDELNQAAIASLSRKSTNRDNLPLDV
jgi:hypothetical protein